MKTRMTTAKPGRPISMSMVAFSIRPLGLFKGAVPRFFWVAPLGAMNLGYELAKKAMQKNELSQRWTHHKTLVPEIVGCFDCWDDFIE
ncbi:unnamed protein product [Brassica rapa]|nr:unnamed protein product [Brassica napus]CAG7889312.1 unnamed protein product [Brassica rapa]